jgi:two-component system, OmpR family, sensor histidine kinase MtrB
VPIAIFPLRRFRVGLRGRVVVAFSLIALLVSTLLATIAWLLVSNFVMSQRLRIAVRLATEQAASLDAGLAQSDPDLPALIDSLQPGPTSEILVRYHDSWFGGLSEHGSSPLPSELVHLVLAGTPATQRITSGNELLLAVGLPLPHSGAGLFELISLDDVNRTLELFTLSLVGAVIVLTLCSTAVGWFASRVALQPLESLTTAASAVAAGNLDARMPGEDDPDLRQLARSFNDTAETLQQRVQADARFAGDVSHELRTPLTTMINSMQLIQNRKAELPDTVLEPVDLLSDDLDRFRRLVVDLIEISRHDSGVAGELEMVVVAQLVTQAADAAAGRQVTSVDPAARDLETLVDKRRLERVFTNLVENAERHGRGCIGVRVSAIEDGVQVIVDDAGPGIPAERRERVFERFARTGNPDGQGSGLGLGLAIVERHVQWHGGTVTVTDRPGGGARFVVPLPLHRLGHS